MAQASSLLNAFGEGKGIGRDLLSFPLARLCHGDRPAFIHGRLYGAATGWKTANYREALAAAFASFC